MSLSVQFRRAVLLGCTAWLGCSRMPIVAVTNGGTALRAFDGNSLDRPAPSPPNTVAPRQSTREALSVVEKRVAAQVQRTLEKAHTNARPRNRANGWPAHPANAFEKMGSLTSEKKNGSSDSFYSPREDRVETLKLVGASGDFCAAVAIASRLAVTALHCAQAFCAPSSQQNPPPLVGCRIRYELSSGSNYVATVVAQSETDLVALLDLRRPLPKFGSLRCDDPHAQDPVYTVGHPGGQNWSMRYGNLSQEPISLEWGTGQSTRVLVADIPTSRGSSGGGLFDIRDNVVGIQIARFAPWSTEFGKSAFIQANRVFSLAGQFCLEARASACIGLRCESNRYDIWGFARN